MVSSDTQQEVIAFLADPATHGGAHVQRIDTHSAMVFLAGPRALKLKRAVQFDYLDFSTEPLRRAACEAEVRINRRAAPSLYRGVVPVTRDELGHLALGGTGRPVDWVVEMARFDEDRLFDRLAARHELDVALMTPLAEAIATFHAGAEPRTDHGGRAGMAWVVRGNAEGFVDQGAGVLDQDLARDLTTRSRSEIERIGDLLDERRRQGFVRQCHGDLHLRNLVLLDGRPTLFDAVEFNDEIACVDVLYDLAFLLMDLWRRGLTRHANALFNSYLAHTADLSGLALLPLFLSCRAAVRAKTSATAARVQTDAPRARELEQLARDYLSMASGLLRPSPARLVAIGGLSGSGKSTLARALAPSIGPVPGAVVIRSDEVRKALFGVPSLKPLGPDGYTPEASARVYRAFEELAATVIASGHSAVVDAVFARQDDRLAVEAVASKTSTAFAGLWLEAPRDTLVSRVAQRGPDASDAGPAVVNRQVEQNLGTIEWRRIEAGVDASEVAARARLIVDLLPIP